MLSALERQRVIDALDKLISARRNAVELIVKRFDGAEVHNDLDAAILETKKAGSKLARLHPDSESLPIHEWTTFKELGIVAAAAREKTHDMTDEARRAWVSNTTAKVREHAAQIDSALQRFRQEMLESPAAHDNPESKLSDQEKQLLSALRSMSPSGLSSKL